MATTFNTESTHYAFQDTDHLNASIAIQDQDTRIDPDRENLLNFLLNSLNDQTDSI